MSLSPADIQQHVFRTSLRGFNQHEVQHFLELVAQYLSGLQHDLQESRADGKRYQRELEDLRSREEGLKEALLTVQRAVDETRQQAQKEANLIIADAQLRAENILHAGQHKLTKMQQENHELRCQKVKLIEDIRNIINTHQQLLDLYSAPSSDQSQHIPAVDRLRVAD